MGVRNPGGNKHPTIWLKHYKNGILTVEEPSEDETEKDDDEKMSKNMARWGLKQRKRLFNLHIHF